MTNPMPGPAFAPGELVAERYTVIRFVDRGGLGEVYEVESRELGEHQALKLLRPERTDDDNVTDRFRREIQIARRVTHPNVCRLYDAGIHGAGTPGEALYLTMEFLDGETLERRLERDGRFSAEEALPLVEQVVGALEAAHQRNVIHRDLKSSNIMLVPTEEGERAVVMDFGLARALAPGGDATAIDFRTRTGSLVGTPGYIAPEQVRGEPPTPAADVYSFGVLLFEMMTGELPFAAETPIETALQRLDEEPPSPRFLAPDLAPRWERVILRCLARRPEDRYRHIADLLDELRAVPGKRDRQTEERGSSRTGRTRGFVALVVAGALAAGLVAWLATSGWQRRAPPALSPLPPVQLTTEPELEMNPAFSPDGQRFVYSEVRVEGMALVVAQLAPGGTRVDLTEPALEAVQPAWSPDGRTISFHSRRDGGIWSIPALGGAPRRLTDFGSSPCYSPDGRTIVFQEDARADVAARASPALPPSTLWSIEAEGGRARAVTSAGQPPGGHGEPAFSPDGTYLVFSSGDRRGAEIWRLAWPGDQAGPAAAEPQLLVGGWRIATHPAFGPDSRNLYLTGIPPGRRETDTHALWRIRLDRSGRAASDPQPVAALGTAAIRDFAVSPTGDRLVYGSLNTRSNLWSLSISGGTTGGPVALTSGHGRNNRPAFSPDGRQLAFDRWYIGQNLDIWWLDFGDSVLHQLTLDPSRDSQPSWTPDGEGVAFVSERSGAAALWRTDLADGSVRRLTEVPAGADWVRLAPTGDRIAYHRKREEGGFSIWVQELDGSPPRRITEGPQSFGFPAWSPDGRGLAAESKQGESSQIALIEVASGEARLLTDGPGLRYPYSWSPSGEHVAYAGLQGEHWNIYSVGLDGTIDQRTAEKNLGGYVRYPAWSPAGDRIVYERAETVGDLWLVEELR